MGNNKLKMKSIIASLVFCAVTTNVQAEPIELDNDKHFWGGNWAKYEADRRKDDDSNDCRLRESHNFLGAQQCKFSWECRGARTCERGGWCSGYDGCEGTALPMQAPGLLADN